MISRPGMIPESLPRCLPVLVLGALLSGCGDGTVEPEDTAPRATTVVVQVDVGTLTALGDTTRATAEVLDQWGSSLADVPVAWSSSDPTVAVVDDAGLVTAVAVGEPAIEAEADGVGGEVALRVLQEVTSIELRPETLRFPAMGDTVRVVALAWDANHHRVEGATFSWASSHPAVAVVDHNGLIRSVGEGEAVISAATDGVIQEAPLFAVQCEEGAVEIPRIDDAPFYRYFDSKIRLNPDSLGIVLDGGDRELMAVALEGAGLSVDSIQALTRGGVRLAELSPSTSLAGARGAVEDLRRGARFGGDARFTFVSLAYRTLSGLPYLPVNRLVVQFRGVATLEEITCLNHRAGTTLERERETSSGRNQWLTYPRGAEPLSMAEFYYRQPLTEWADAGAVLYINPNPVQRRPSPIR